LAFILSADFRSKVASASRLGNKGFLKRAAPVKKKVGPDAEQMIPLATEAFENF